MRRRSGLIGRVRKVVVGCGIGLDGWGRRRLLPYLARQVDEVAVFLSPGCRICYMLYYHEQ
jgi:hypothetical protein